MTETGPRLRLVDGPSSGDVGDAVLLARVAQGDEAAARAFVLRHQAAVVRFLGRMLGTHDEALDDVVQQTLLAALQSAHRYDGRAQARTWVLGIAHNKAKMTLRGRMRRRRFVERFTLFQRSRPAAVDHDAAAGQTLDRIEAAVHTLDPDRRAAFVLCEVEERTSREAAEILGVPEGTVRRWRSEARKALQPQLADLWSPGGTP